MVITRATDYTIRALLHMAERHPARVVAKEEVCAAEGITPAFLTKILQPLIHAGLVRSKRGVKGGFALERDPEKVTVLDVLRLVEEPFTLSECLDSERVCGFSRACPVRDLWGEARQKMEEVFASRTLADLAWERAGRRGRSRT